jgi:hypothetical protein
MTGHWPGLRALINCPTANDTRDERRHQADVAATSWLAAHRPKELPTTDPGDQLAILSYNKIAATVMT